MLGCIVEKRPHAGQLARCGRRSKPLETALSHERAQIDCGQLSKVARVDGAAAMPFKEDDQAMRGRHISAHCMGGSTAVVLEKTGPTRGKRAAAA